MDHKGENDIAVVLLSGGIDSAVAAMMAKEEFYSVQPIFLDRRYKGTSHGAYEKEKKAVQSIVSLLKIEDPYFIEIPFKWYAERKRGYPGTRPIARNLIFLSVAASYAAINFPGSRAVLITGFNKSDSWGDDTSEDFVNAFKGVVREAIAGNNDFSKVDISAPLIETKMEKSDCVKYAYGNGGEELIKNTWSCYEGGKLHCGECDNCTLRKKSFKEAGIGDPTEYLK